MSVNAEKLLRTAFGEIEKVVTANIAIGAPLHFEGTTIIPVVGMSVDFGGGGGSGLEKGMGESESSKEAASGAGGGAGCGFTIKPVALIIIDKKEVRIEQLNIEHLKFERLPAQSPYQSPSPLPSEESLPKSEMVDSDRDLAKEVNQLRRDIKELQMKLGVNPSNDEESGRSHREKIQPHFK
jgi:uncharacterized spore protein YtfJ